MAEAFRGCFERPAVEAVTGRRLDAGPQLSPRPGAVEEGMTRYCPRCLMAYGEVGVECIDCGGVATRALPVG